MSQTSEKRDNRCLRAMKCGELTVRPYVSYGYHRNEQVSNRGKQKNNGEKTDKAAVCKCTVKHIVKIDF